MLVGERVAVAVAVAIGGRKQEADGRRKVAMAVAMAVLGGRKQAAEKNCIKKSENVKGRCYR